MRLSRIVIAAVTVVVLGLGLTALFNAGGTTQTNSVATVNIGVANTPVQSEITIPNVRGEPAAQASQAFFSLGFEAVYAANITEPGEEAGTVVEQMPAAGSRGTLDNTTIHLMIAASGPGNVQLVPHPKG
jgi:hypothetical protein